MFTTCCPSWYQYCEKLYPDLLNHLSTVKSPQANLGSLVKTYFAEKKGIPVEKIKHFVIAPCVVKKDEAKDKDYWVIDNVPNIDEVVTTMELADIIKESGIDFKSLTESSFDEILGKSSGAGAIFGTTGGVMEATLRTAYFYLTGKELEKYELTDIRNAFRLKTGVFLLGQYRLKIATFNDILELKGMLDELRSNGKVDYHFVEVMNCPGGCIGGIGQMTQDPRILQLRREALFKYDEQHNVRSAHQNEEIKKLYSEYLGEIGGGKAKEILHTRRRDLSELEMSCPV